MIEFHDGEMRLSIVAPTEQVEEKEAPVDDRTDVKSGEDDTSELPKTIEEVDAKSEEEDTGELRQGDEQGTGKAEEEEPGESAQADQDAKEEAGESTADDPPMDTVPVDLNLGVDIYVHQMATEEEDMIGHYRSLENEEEEEAECLGSRHGEEEEPLKHVDDRAASEDMRDRGSSNGVNNEEEKSGESA
jgi:hypothetical protein